MPLPGLPQALALAARRSSLAPWRAGLALQAIEERESGPRSFRFNALLRSALTGGPPLTIGVSGGGDGKTSSFQTSKPFIATPVLGRPRPKPLAELSAVKPLR